MSINSNDRVPQGSVPTLPLPAWGHASGMLSLRTAQPPVDAAAAADRMLFTECIARYCWSYDERQPQALAACFTDDALWEGNVLGRVAVGPFRGRDRIVAWLSDFWPHQRDQRRHMLLNTIVEEQERDSAVSLSYLLLLGSDGKQVRVETSGFYRVAYRRSESQWQIQRLTAGFDAPFWPGDLDEMSPSGRARHGVAAASPDPNPKIF